MKKKNQDEQFALGQKKKKLTVSSAVGVYCMQEVASLFAKPIDKFIHILKGKRLY